MFAHGTEQELLRACIFHSPADPFREHRALESYLDGALLIRAGRIAACGSYQEVHAAFPEAPVTNWRGGFLLPGLIDTHTHFPQLRVLGSLGKPLLEWLQLYALPEEARMADSEFACRIAQQFVHGLLSHGTTAALVFGAHFFGATAALFEAAASAGLRLAAGQVLSDRWLPHELRCKPEDAYRDCTELIRRFHRRGRLLYAVTPRFALSASEAILEVCQTLLSEHRDLLLQTHLNENPAEMEEVARLFPWASGYLAVYERYALCRPHTVLAHNVHPTQAELDRLAASGAAIAHCPCSNAALGSGLFPLGRHLAAGVPCALGTDVGGGTGFGLLKEALQAYLLHSICPESVLLTPAQLLYLATLAGAKALGLEHDIGDFRQGKAADFVYIRPAPGTSFAAVLEREHSPEDTLAAIFTLAGPESIQEVRIEGTAVFRSSPRPC